MIFHLLPFFIYFIHSPSVGETGALVKRLDVSRRAEIYIAGTVTISNDTLQ